MKKILTGLFLTITVVALAQTTTPIPRFLPLLTGYNVYAPTNVSNIGLNGSNILYTTYGGQVLYSYTNNNYLTSSNSTTLTLQNTNVVAADAFKVIHLRPNANGDWSSNAVLVIATGNSNLLIENPNWFTNSFGQVTITNWPLAISQYPNWQQPASANTYTLFGNNVTNSVIISLYRAPAGTAAGDLGSGIAPAYHWWETTAAYTYTENVSASVPTVTMVNLPVGFLNGAIDVYANVTVGSGIAGQAAAPAIVINQLGIEQPQP